MALKIVEMHHVGLRIATDQKGIERTRNFYSEVLGVTPDTGRPDFPDLRGYWINVGENSQLHLMAMEGDSPRTSGPGQDPTLPHIAYAVEDIIEAKAELDRMGVKYWTLDALGVEDALLQIFFNDPSGNMIELHQADICRCTLRRRIAAAI